MTWRALQETDEGAWPPLRQYSLGLILAGGVCWIVGLTTVIGGGGVSMSLHDTDLPAGPSPKATIYQRVDRWLTGPVSSLGFMLTMVAAGLVPLAAGWTMVTLLRR